MTALFPKWTNKLPALVALALPVVAVSVVFTVWFWFSPKHTDVGYAPVQPILYSHLKHASQLGMDCRYCHREVEHGAHATVPDADTCMGCHKQVKTDSVLLTELREKYGDGKGDNPAIEWVKVHMLPDYAYFNHAVHVGAGVGCASCHGRVDQMEVVRQAEPLSMGWCLECHREPEKHLRPLDKITDMNFTPDPVQGLQFKKDRNLHPPTHCSACHR